MLVPILDIYMHTSRKHCFHIQILKTGQIIANTEDTHCLSINKNTLDLYTAHFML
jgi:hypothetical protein